MCAANAKEFQTQYATSAASVEMQQHKVANFLVSRAQTT